MTKHLKLLYTKTKKINYRNVVESIKLNHNRPIIIDRTVFGSVYLVLEMRIE